MFILFQVQTGPFYIIFQLIPMRICQDTNAVPSHYEGNEAQEPKRSKIVAWVVIGIKVRDSWVKYLCHGYSFDPTKRPF